MKKTIFALTFALTLSVAFAAEPGLDLKLGAGLEAGLFGLSLAPVAELNWSQGVYGFGGRLGATIGTIQGTDCYLTAAGRAYLWWLYAEAGASFQVVGLSAAKAGQVRYGLPGVTPTFALGLAIPAGESLRVCVQLAFHATDILTESSNTWGDLIAAPLIVALGSIKPGIFVEYELPL